MSPDITISNGDTEQIINQFMASRAADDASGVEKFIIYTDSNIRIGTEDEQDQIRDGLPILTDTYLWDFDPNGHQIYAYADGAQATVTVQQQKFTFNEG